MAILKYLHESKTLIFSNNRELRLLKATTEHNSLLKATRERTVQYKLSRKRQKGQ